MLVLDGPEGDLRDPGNHIKHPDSGLISCLYRIGTGFALTINLLRQNHKTISATSAFGWAYVLVLIMLLR